MVVELALNRLAVPALRPATENPGQWHRNLDRVALFVFHFASVLSIAVMAKLLWDQVRARTRLPKDARILIGAAGGSLGLFALWSILQAPSLGVQFAMQSAFTLTLLFLLRAQFRTGGDWFVKLGIFVLAVPLLVQYYAPLMLHLSGADLSLYPNVPEYVGLPDQVRTWGQNALIIAALISPYVFAPRPLRASVPRVAPLVIATFVAMIGGIVIRNYYEVGMQLAMEGLGIQIGPPGAPRSLIALYLLALASITWTVVSCLTADSPSRRRIGVGVGLVAIAGYAFSWPLQYVVATVGLLVVHDASDSVDAEEAALADADDRTFQSPPIPNPAWKTFVSGVVAALRERAGGDPEAASAVSFDKQGGITETHIVTRAHGVSVQVHIVRADEAIQLVDVHCGGDVPDATQPSWTLHARPERMLSIGSHPEPPPTSAPVRKTGDPPFDRRFRVRDDANLTDDLLDELLRARATALVDGWVAFWPARCLYYRVYPGRGAPLDHPVPISELAFRGHDTPVDVERLLSVIDLLGEIASRVELQAAEPAPVQSAKG